MEQQTWKCLCGTENTGNFCTTCGRAKDNQQQFNNAPSNSFTEQYMMMQLKQQELEHEQEEKRLRLQEEKERKQREYTEKLNEYNEQVTTVKLNTIKKWSGSWVVLTLAILSSIAAALAIISTFSNFNLLSMFSGLVNIVLTVIPCIGFWLFYSQGKSKANTMKATGPKMLRGILIFNKVIVYIAYIAVLVLMFILLIAVMAMGEMINELMSSSDMDLSFIGSGLTGIVIALIVLVAAVFVFYIIFYSLASKFSKNAIYCITNRNVLNVKATGIAVLFIIVGAISLISAISSIGMSAIMSERLSAVLEMAAESEFFATLQLDSLIGLLGVNWTGIISQVVTALTYIFSAILAIQFGKLYGKANSQIALIEKPQL